MTRGYRGLQEVTKAYEKIQGVKGGDNGLQGVTRASKIVFSRFIFTIYDMGIKGLQGVTVSYKRLQGVKRGDGSDKVLQGITKGCKGLQGVTTGDKRLQGVWGG